MKRPASTTPSSSTKNDDGAYYAVTDTESRFYKNVFAVDVPAAHEFRFLDWCDPEADAPTELSLKEMLTRYSNDEIHSTEDNTEVTFDENGRVTQIIYRYPPWN